MTLRGALPVGFVFATFAAALSLGCRPAPSPLAVEFGGCKATLFPGPVCVLAPDRTLVLWLLPPPRARIEIRAGDRLLTANQTTVGEGRRYEVAIPPGADRIEVRAVASESAPSIWSLALSSPDLQGEIDRRAQTIHGVVQELRLGEAREMLDDLDDLAPPAELPAESRFLLAFYRGSLAARQEDYRTALVELDRAAAIAERADLRAEIWFAAQTRAIRLADLGRSREAAESFARLARAREFDNPCQEAQLLNNWAWATLLAREANSEVANSSLAEPVPLLAQTLEILRANPRCRNRLDLVLDAHLNLVLAQLQAGRPDLAATALSEARARHLKGTLFQRLWELDLEARIALARNQPRQALGIYEQLNAIARESGSPDGQLRAALGRARANAALGNRDLALRLLAEADHLLNGASLRIPLHEGRETFVSQREGVASLEVQLLLDAGQKAAALDAARRARTRFLRQLAFSERLSSLTTAERKVWNDAIESYQEVRKRANEAAAEEWRLPGVEKEAARAAREERAGEAERQLDRAFKALSGPVTFGALPLPQPGELFLAFHPLPSGWVAFAADRAGIATHTFVLTRELLDQPELLAREILVPFRDRILRTKRIRILPYGALRDIDFHKLPFENDVLLAALPVIYGLDLATAPTTPDSTEDGAPQALVVANPNGNLPGSLREADAVADAIRAWTPGWKIDRLTAAGADQKGVLKGLGTAELFHFSGHGTFGGFGGWDSGLRLANRSLLTVGDLLVLNHAPRWAVLSGCETGRAEGAEARIEGFGLANALVIAGSRGVIASVRPVADRTAPPLFKLLYNYWDGRDDMASALRQAQLKWRKEYPKVDWATFRMIEP